MTISANPIFVTTKILGGLGTDRSNSIQISQDGSVYLAGEASASFDGQIFSGNWDGFLSKYSEDGTKLWTKFLGGSGSEFIRCISVGKSGSVYAAGYTNGSFQGENNLGNYDAFLTKYLETGEVAWTKFIGSSQSDFAYSVFSDADESIYISGPSNGSFDGNVNSGGADGFLSKYDENGTKVWSIFIGGIGDETPRSLTGDSEGNIYLVGYTTGSLDGNTNSGNRDSFITKISPSGEKIWTKFFGGASDDDAVGTAIGFDGSIYVAGGTRSDFASQTNNGDYDAFLTKYSADGELIWTKFVGGTGREIAQSLTISTDGSIIISGEASSSFDGQVSSGLTDSFVSKISEDGTTIWTKFIGTNPDQDLSTSSATASNGRIYISGYSSGSFDSISTAGGTDSYITQFLDSLSSDNASDSLVGGAYDDLLIGNGGDDALKGGNGSDTIDGGDGNDTADYSDKSTAVSVVLNGTTAATVTVNNLTEDSIFNIENLIGGSGDDSFTGDSADNTLTGGDGDDVLDGSDGIDTADYSDKSTAVSVVLNGTTAATVTVNNVAEDSIVNIENLIGGSAGDSFTGDDLDNNLQGGDGDDTLTGGDGDDVLDGGGGNDTADYSDKSTSVSVILNETTAATVTVNGLTEDSIVDIENLIGGSGNDSFTGDDLENKLEGGDGDDTLKGGDGDDVLEGGDGNDTADYSDKSDAVNVTLNGSVAATVLVDGIAEDTISDIENLIGGSGDDSFVGGSENNKLEGKAGDDKLKGCDGNDVLDGGADSDTADYSDKVASVVVILNASTAATVTVNGIAEDTINNIENLIGGSGDDSFTGDSLDNKLEGGYGADTLKGNAGFDTLDGGNGNDTADYSDKSTAVSVVLNGTTAATVTVNNVSEDSIINIENLIGGSGTDSFTGDSFSNTFKGGAGKDTLNGGAGIDTADYSEKTLSVSATLNGSTAVTVNVGGVAEDSLRNIENIIGGSAGDTLIGDSFANIFMGGAGNDTLNGNSGSDTADYSDKSNSVSVTLNGSNSVSVRVGGVIEDSIRNIENIIGGSGVDTLTGDSLANTFKGGSGNDVLNGNSGIDTADYSDKTDSVRVTLTTSTAASVYVDEVIEDSIRNIENVIGGSGDDSLTGDTLSNTFKGGDGNDTLNGGTGTDTADYSDKTFAVRVTLTTSTAASVFVNDFAEDLISNIENIIGGSGNDTLTGDSLANSLSGGDGNDTLKGAGGIDTLNGGAGIDTADFSDQTAAVVATLNGATQITVTIGGSSSDRLSSIENLVGGSVNDTLTGDMFANILSGGNGADRLAGGAGNDVLNGGLGIDRFSFTTTLNALTNLDTIEDFASGVDKIGLRSTIFSRFSSSVGSGNLVVNATGNAGDSSDYLIFNTANNTLYYDADGSGAGAKIAFAVLTGVTTLANTDFVIV